MTTAHHHQTPTGWLLVLLVLAVLLYIALRTGSFGKLRSRAGLLRLRGELRGVHVRPAALVPTAVLVIVVVVLLVTH